MKQMRLFIFLYPALTLASCSYTHQEGAFTPGAIWSDHHGIHINAHGGGVLYHEGSYYWFGEHKTEGKAGNRANVGVHVYSSDNLYDWTDEGIALAVSEDTTSDIQRGCILERPKVIYNATTGQFVMWFHLELKGRGYKAARSGVAVAERVTGPYTFIRSLRPNAGHWPRNVKKIHKMPVGDHVQEYYCGGEGCLPAHPDTVNLLGRDFEKGQMARDQTLFVDDDGTAYHLYSSEENSTLHISQLTDDYLSFTGNYARVFPNRYMEAPAIFKKDGKYYFIGSGCTGWKPNAARLAVAEDIFGPWTELGNPCRGPGSALTFRSQSTFILPVESREDAFIYMGDRWMPDNAIDGRYIWLPIRFDRDGVPYMEWMDAWNLQVFDR